MGHFVIMQGAALILLVLSLLSLADAEIGRNDRQRAILDSFASLIKLSPVMEDHFMRFSEVITGNNFLGQDHLAVHSKNKFNSGDSTMSSGWWLNISFSKTSTCDPSVARFITGVCLGCCELQSTSSTHLTYDQFSCLVDSESDTLTITEAAFYDDSVCDGDPTSTPPPQNFPLCDTSSNGDGDEKTAFFNCTEQVDAYQNIPGFTCIYWDTSNWNCNMTQQGSAFTTTPNGTCVDGSISYNNIQYESYQATFFSSNNTAVNTYFTGSGCNGQMGAVQPYPAYPSCLPTDTNGEEYSYCFIVGG